MPDLRFRGLAARNPDFPNLLAQYYGYRAQRDGGDWVVPANDPSLRAGPPDMLEFHGQREIHPQNFEELARHLTELVPSEFDLYQPSPPDQVHLSSDYGLLSDVEEIITKVSISPKSQVEAILAEELLPFLYENLHARFVTPVTLSASKQQAYTSIAKIVLLNELFGTEETSSLISGRNSLDGVLPQSLDFLSFLEALTRFSPIAFTLPVRRWGCMWHFQAEAMWSFPHAPTHGIFREFYYPLNPLGADVGMYGFAGLTGMSEQNVWRYLRACVEGLNALLSYMNDPRNFTTATGEVDYLKQIQTYSLMNLVFADLLGMNYSTSSHNRISYAFSTLYKIGNIKKALGSFTETETSISTKLCSYSQKEKLKNIFRRKLDPIRRELSDSFIAVTEEAYEGLHSHLAQEIGDAANTESSRLERLRMMRNVYSHGTFLSKNQFENTFLKASGTLPEGIAMIPFLLVLGLTLDPRDFLTFDPQIGTE